MSAATELAHAEATRAEAAADRPIVTPEDVRRYR